MLKIKISTVYSELGQDCIAFQMAAHIYGVCVCVSACAGYGMMEFSAKSRLQKIINYLVNKEAQPRMIGDIIDALLVH